MGKRRRLESEGSARLKKFMMARGWKMFRITPGMYGSAGVPDWYAVHEKFGDRWIENKKRGGKLSPVQVSFCRTLARAGIGVFILWDHKDYPKLFKEPNWYLYVC